MKNRKLYLWIAGILWGWALSVQAQEKPFPISTVLFQDNTPVIISVSNKEASGGVWNFDHNQNPSIELVQEKHGYLFTYFTVKVTDPKTPHIIFLSDKGKKRIFALRKSSLPSSPQEIYGDIPSLKDADGILSQVSQATYTPVNTSNLTPYSGIITPKDSLPIPQSSSPEAPVNSNITSPQEEMISSDNPNGSPSDTPHDSVAVDNPLMHLNPAITKQYIQKLIDNKLIPQARHVFEQLIARPDIDPSWKYLIDLKLSNDAKNYQEVLDKSSKMLGEKLPSEDTEIAIREDRAKAMEKLGQLDEAQAALLYNISYFPNEPRAHVSLADFYLRNKQYSKALQELLTISSNFPDLEDLDAVYYKIANCYTNIMGNDGYGLALSYYNKVLTFGPGSPYYRKSKDFVDFLQKNILDYY